MEYIVDKRKDVYTILGELAVLGYFDFEVFIPNGALLLENRLNLEFLQESLEKLGKSVSFSTDSANGMEMLSSLSGEAVSELDSGVLGGELKEESGQNSVGAVAKITSALASFKFPKISLPSPKLGILPIIIGLLLLGGVVFGATRFINSQKAYVKLVVKSEPLARSITVLVDADLPKETDAKLKAFKGKQVSKSFSEEITKDSTGEKIEGEKASGEVLIYNRTESDIKLKKGTVLEFDGFAFKLDEEVTVPAVSYEDPEDPASVMVPGEKSAKVVASDIGPDHNIEKGETLEFSDYKKTELVAKSSVDFKGGSSDTIKVVSQEDIDSALVEVKNALVQKTSENLADSVGSGYIYIDGSSSVAYANPEIGAKSGDEAPSVTVRQTANATGLSYSEKVLEKLILQLLEEFVPESFEPSGDKIEIKAASLGNSDETVVTSTKADLQVTAKTTVIPSIDIEDLKSKLAGKSITEASRILGGIRTLNTYEFKLQPNLPFSQKVPQDLDRIIIEVEEKD